MNEVFGKKNFQKEVDFDESRWYINKRRWRRLKKTSSKQLTSMKQNDILFLVADEAEEKIVLWKLNKAEKTSTLIQVTICNKTSCFKQQIFMSYSNTLLESLILAQDERWRRA